MSAMLDTCNKNEVNSKLQDIALYHMHVTRIDSDNQYVALYQNNVGMVYKTMRLHGNIYPQELTLHVYGKMGLINYKRMTIGTMFITMSAQGRFRWVHMARATIV